MEFTKDIKFNNSPIANDTLTITYNGYLGQSSNLWITYGFGENWENTNEAEMNKIENGFVANIKLENFDTFNFCFRNENHEWDNNYGFNFITPILPKKNPQVDVQEIESLFDELLESDKQPQNVQTFDLDSLIDEILQPIAKKQSEVVNDNTPVQINEEPVNLGIEITNILSQIDTSTPEENLASFSSLDEILSGTVIKEKTIDLFEEPILTETQNPIQNVEGSQKSEQNALVNIENPFTISPRKLSKFYLWRKKIKLAFYKALIKLPKLIFGTDEQ